jgi:hypothetical protein
MFQKELGRLYSWGGLEGASGPSKPPLHQKV